MTDPKTLLSKAMQILQRAIANADGADMQRVTAFVFALASGQLDVPDSAQRPELFHFPGLDARPFHTPTDRFAWVAALEAEAPAIEREVRAMLGESGCGLPSTFEPYVDRTSYRQDKFGTASRDSWQTMDVLSAEARARCPRTHAAVAALREQGVLTDYEMPYFSLLEPGAHIRPHYGMVNTHLTCHLALTGTSGCEIRVGAQTSSWQPHRCLIFDDSYEHEVRHRGGERRVVLLIPVWHPGLSGAERGVLQELLRLWNDRTAGTTTEEQQQLLTALAAG